MADFIVSTLGAFIPIFVAIDVAGCIIIFVSMTHDLEHPQLLHIVNTAAVFSVAIALTFVLLGKAIFQVLGITSEDFQIAGGVLLFGYAVVDLLGVSMRTRHEASDMGIVPLATPLLAGPALLTTEMLMVERFGMLQTIIAVVLNLALVWLALRQAHRVKDIIGRPVLLGGSKIIMILLAGIGVMMVRQGLTAYFG